MAAYYNEIDCYAAQWLKNLISNGLIAECDVDTLSIKKLSLSEGNYDVPESKGLLWCFLYTIVYERYLDIMLDITGCIDADV